MTDQTSGQITVKELLEDAACEIADWGAYAGEYFQKKWRLAEQVERFKRAAKLVDPNWRIDK